MVRPLRLPRSRGSAPQSRHPQAPGAALGDQAALIPRKAESSASRLRPGRLPLLHFLRPLSELARATVANSDLRTSQRYFDYLIDCRLPSAEQERKRFFAYEGMSERMQASLKPDEEPQPRRGGRAMAIQRRRQSSGRLPDQADRIGHPHDQAGARSHGDEARQDRSTTEEPDCVLMRICARKLIHRTKIRCVPRVLQLRSEYPSCVCKGQLGSRAAVVRL